MEPDFELLMNLLFDKSVQDEFIRECREIGITLENNPCENCQEFSCDYCIYRRIKK